MANPQKENGFTAISNEIMEALAKIRIPGEARQMLDVIIRKTYGFNKKEDIISTSQLCEFTGLKPFIIHRARKKLLSMGIIRVSKNANGSIGVSKFDYGKGLSYSFIKDYENWIPIRKNAHCAKMLMGGMQKSTRGVCKKVLSGVTNIDVYKRHNITKDNIHNTITKERFPYLKDDSFVLVFESYLTNRKKKATSHAKELLLKDLHLVSQAEAVAMLEQSIKNGWIGVFPLKKENNNGKNRNNIGQDSSQYAGLEKPI